MKAYETQYVIKLQDDSIREIAVTAHHRTILTFLSACLLLTEPSITDLPGCCRGSDFGLSEETVLGELILLRI